MEQLGKVGEVVHSHPSRAEQEQFVVHLQAEVPGLAVQVAMERCSLQGGGFDLLESNGCWFTAPDVAC